MAKVQTLFTTKDTADESPAERHQALESQRATLLQELNRLEAERINLHTNKNFLKNNEPKIRALNQQLAALDEKYFKSSEYVTFETTRRGIKMHSAYSEDERGKRLQAAILKLKESSLYKNFIAMREKIRAEVFQLEKEQRAFIDAAQHPNEPNNNKNRRDELYNGIIKIDREIEALIKPIVYEYKIDPEVKEAKLKDLNITATFYRQEVEPILADRHQHQDKFNHDVTEFIRFLKEQGRIDEFLEVMAHITAQGIVETSMRKNRSDTFYHDGPHAAELVSDVSNVLMNLYKPETDSAEARIFTALSCAAAAYHDVIQGKSDAFRMKANEELSANEFAHILKIAIDNQFKNESSLAIQNFKENLSFLAYHLIVPSTYLIRPQNKPLLHYVLYFENSPNKDQPKMPLDHIDEGAIAISFCDTNRSLLIDAMKEKSSLKECSRASSQSKNIFEKLFSTLGYTTENEQESFLIRMGQNFRMFPELNRFRSGDGKLSAEEMNLLFKLAGQEDRIKSKNTTTSIPPGRLLDVYLYNIANEINFAKSLANPIHVSMAALKNATPLLENIDKNGWERHAKDLQKFQLFVSDLTPGEKDILATALMTLAGHQPGCDLMSKNPNVQDALRETKMEPSTNSPRSVT